jgi:hypothetical protein
LNQSKSRTLIQPDRITPAMIAQTTTATTVVRTALRRTISCEGAPGGVPGTTVPESPCVVSRSGSTMKNTMNQTTANRTSAAVTVIRPAPARSGSR